MDLTVKASESNHVINIYFIQMFLDRWAKRRFREAGIELGLGGKHLNHFSNEFIIIWNVRRHLNHLNTGLMHIRRLLTT